MSAPRVIRADYASWRPVAGRKVLQIVCEIPIEQTELAMQMLGVPMPGESKWVAIALLENGKPAGERNAGSQKQMPKQSENSAAAGNPTGHEPKHTNVNTAETGISETHRKFSDLPLSQQAAIRCGDTHFQDFIRAPDVEEAANYVRLYCGVDTRGKLNDPNHPGVARWRQLEAKFQAHLMDRKYAQVAR